MRQPVAALKTGWLAFALPKYRPHPKPSTYSLFSYDQLPVIQGQFDDEYQWLQAERIKDHPMADSGYSDGTRPNLGKLSGILSQAPVAPPEAFTSFISSPELHQRLRSCTDCYFDVADRPVRTVGVKNGFLIHFLSDSQWCAHWYIHADFSGEHFIAASFNAYGFSDDLNADGNAQHANSEIDLAQEEIWFCSPTFSEFLYRFWLENEIWYALALDKQPLAPIQQAYVDHYRQASLQP